MGLREELIDVMEADGASRALAPLRLCEFAVDRLGVQGVGVALIASPESRSLLSASGEFAGTVEDLQFSLGEGPCLDAFQAIAPALEADLANGGRARWPAFAGAALEHGIHAVFAFPLRIGAACFGVLDLARDRPGMLNDEQAADAATLAELASATVLAIQAQAPFGSVADELGGVGSERIAVHQATGMVAAQAGVGIPDALARLRAYSYSQDRSLTDVASDVIAQRLAFER